MIEFPEVQRLLRKSDWTIRRWIRDGKIPSPDQRIGQTMLWNRSRFLAWLDGGVDSRAVILGASKALGRGQVERARAILDEAMTGLEAGGRDAS